MRSQQGSEFHYNVHNNLDTTNNAQIQSLTNYEDDDDDENCKSNRNHDDFKIDAYCTLRSRPTTVAEATAAATKIPKLFDSDENSKIDLTKFYTVNKKFKNFIRSKGISQNSDIISTNNTTSSLPYSKLRESGEFGSFSISSSSSSSSSSASSGVVGAINFGLSKDLSTESIKNVCDCFDEISDDYDGTEETDMDVNRKLKDQNCQQRHKKNLVTVTNQAINKSHLNRINNTESNHNFKRSFPLRFSTLDRRKMLKEHFHPYCTIRRDKNHDDTNDSSTSNEFQSEDAKDQQTAMDNNRYLSIKSSIANSPVNNSNNDNGNDDEMMTTAITTTTTTMTVDEECPRESSVTSAEAYHILCELDEILNNHLIAAENVSSSSSSTPLSKTRTTSPSDCTVAASTTSKIEDCLLELDAYLEEIDQENYQFDDTKSIYSNKDATLPRNICLQYFRRSRTLPKKNRSSEDRHGKNSNGAYDGATEAAAPSSFRHGQKLRNTIGGPSNSQLSKLKASKFNQNLTGTTNEDDDCDNDCRNKVFSSLNRLKNWRRHSMRKTSLFTLPDQKEKNTVENNNDNSTGTTKYEQNELSDERQEIIATTASTSSALDLVQLSHENVAFTNEGFQTSEDIPSASTQQQLFNDVRRCLSQEDCTNITNQRQNLTHLDIIHDILRHSSQDGIQGRPKQLGRRADQHPRIVSIMAETNPLSGNQRIIVNHDRPSSAPAAAAAITASSSSSLINRTSISSPLTSSDCSRYIGSEPSSVGSSRNPSPVSLLSSTASSSTASAGPDQTTPETCSHRPSLPEPAPNHHIHVPSRSQGNNSQWPHGFSRILALLCCTLGLFNISRFSILTIHYGGNFLLQFLLLSIIFGIPMLWLQMCLGAKIKCGPVSMWKISPICKGIGISLIIAQCVIALYSTISLGWVMVYFRDSFISRNEYYRWQEPFLVYRRSGNGSIASNNLTETVADYFNGIVLQRWQLGLGRRSDAGGVRFQLAFNLAIIWTVVFIVLCKGLKSFGKIVLGLTVIPLLLFIVTTCKLLYLIDFSSVQNIFLASDFEDFLINSKTWTAAAQETFFTWTLLGPSIIAISSKSAEKTEGKTILRRDAVLVVFMTLFGLSLAAIFGYACIQILQNNDYLYIPGSYEHLDTYTFLYSLHGPISPSLLSIPVKWSPHYSSILGEAYRRPAASVATAYRESGYQVLRLVTELFPATIAVATQEQISSIWSIMTFLIFLMFGLGQLCAMWKPISSALGDSTSSVLLSCVTGLLLGIPFATEMGLSIIHYLDTVLGGAWWILILWTAQIFAVFLIRGRPYNGDDLVKDLRMSGSMSAFLALSWNVLLPVGLITLAIIEYKISLAGQFFNWRSKSYFHLWTRKVAGLIQISFLMVIPITAIIQIYRYLTGGPPDILDRIQLLYRPLDTPPPNSRNRSNPERSPTIQTGAVGVTLTNLDAASAIQDDAPPKYTPPPSYTTATGARIAKLLRQSIRRSVRRILGEPSRHRPSIPPTSRATSSAMDHDSSLPPEYSTVLNNPSGNIDVEIGSRVTTIVRPSSENLPRSTRSSGNRNRQSPSYTAFDVAQILRPSSSTLTHNHHEINPSPPITTALDHILRSSSLRYNHHHNKSRSPDDHLVLNAAPLGESNAIILGNTTTTMQNTEERVDNNNSESTSVI